MTASIATCPHFPTCSGCHSIGVPYEEQLAAKLRAARDLFASASLTTFDSDSLRTITPSPNPIAYRNRAKLVPARVGDRLVLGLYKSGTHEVVDIPGCPVQTDLINEVVEVIRSGIEKLDVELYDEVQHCGDLRFITVRHGVGTGEILVGVVTRTAETAWAKSLASFVMERCPAIVGVVQNVNDAKGNVIFGDRSILLGGRDYIEEMVCGTRVRLGVTSFFQINTGIAEKAYERIASLLTGDNQLPLEDVSTAESESAPQTLVDKPPVAPGVSARQALVGKPPVAPGSASSDDQSRPQQKPTTLLDLYCGVGTIGLTIASRVDRVVGIEEFAESVELARAAATDSTLPNCDFRQGLVEESLPALLSELAVIDSQRVKLQVVVNPPRKGLASSVIESLAATRPHRIAYLSCAPNTLLRDLRRFESHGFRVRHVELFDMFPQTLQVETLAIIDGR